MIEVTLWIDGAPHRHPDPLTPSQMMAWAQELARALLTLRDGGHRAVLSAAYGNEIWMLSV